jgi:hypothetical protein
MIRIQARRLPQDASRLRVVRPLGLAVALALAFGMGAAHAQAVYPTPEAAAEAFENALATSDHDAMKHVMGANFQQFIPTQNIGEEDIYDFLGAWSKGHQIGQGERASRGG